MRSAEAVLDVQQLVNCHPLLPHAEAAIFTFHAAHALRRQGHQLTDVELIAKCRETVVALQLCVPLADSVDRLQLDDKRVSENAAYAVALCYVACRHGLRVRRRLQEGEHADWLLRDDKNQELVAVEVGGTTGPATAYLAKKLAQLRDCVAAPRREAIVVGFRKPELLHKGVV